MKRTARLLGLVLYAAATLGGAGSHLLEFAPEDDCSACHGHPTGARLVAPCDGGSQPCGDRNHTHHDHPVHQHEDGCTTCGALSTQHADATSVTAVHVVEGDVVPSPATALPAATATDRPPGRAPPAL